MSRSGYGDDLDNGDLIRWRGQVASATRGKRGQKMLRDMLAAFDAMPDHYLLSGVLVAPDGECCALGAVLVHRGIVAEADAAMAPEYFGLDNDLISDLLDVSECLVREVENENDEGAYQETGAERWTRMRAWVAARIRP